MFRANSKKVLITVVVFAAIALILVGIFYAANCASQETKRETISTQSVDVPQNAYKHIHLKLNSSEENRWLSIKIVNGTLREACLSDELYQDWLNGSYNITWCEMPNPAWPHYSNNYEESCPLSSSISTHYIFWNLDSHTKQVTLTTYITHKETAYNTANLVMGNLFILLGTVGLTKVGLSFAVKNLRKVTRKTAFTLIGFLLIIVLGNFLAVTYSNPIESKQLVSQGTVEVPANDYYPISCLVTNDGNYILQIAVEKGDVQIYRSSDDSPIDQWSNGTEFDVRDQVLPIFNGSSGLTGCSLAGDGAAFTEYFLISNMDAYSKNVTYDFVHYWTYKNYVVSTAGIALLIFGVIMFILTLLKGKFKAFNQTFTR